MELKEYQRRTLDQIKTYLDALAKEGRDGNLKHASEDAWEEVGLDGYKERRNGLGRDLPNFCLKIPTGGGKTLLAVKTIDLINASYRGEQSGLVLWVVPSSQIYNQTLRALRDRSHPYRQALDIASAGRTLVVEKTDRFTKLDVVENLVVMMLMLPSASRQNKETLRLFRDSGGFAEFFPPEDNFPEQEKLLERFPNLDTFGESGSFWSRQIKTSLGNTLRLLQPVIILDEGHRAYSETAQATLRGFNPSLILELSATPRADSNVLVDIRGRELEKEQMIKLDLHIANSADPDWKATLHESIELRNRLEQDAREYEAETGEYIRPISLIQVERTGRDQRDGNLIHSEEVREHLIKLGIPADQVAVKTSEKDELKEVDDSGGLLSRDSHIRYIITKQALQEGWDCPFAYVLTVLTNPGSVSSLTQLVGRILRQPYARKTHIKTLDESYVFAFRQEANALLEAIRHGFDEEGLGDLKTSVLSGGSEGDTERQEKTIYVREQFKKAAAGIVLPLFAIKDRGIWRPVRYDTDILSRVDWAEANIDPIYELILEERPSLVMSSVSLSDDEKEVIRTHDIEEMKSGKVPVVASLIARYLHDITPNPWQGAEFGGQVLCRLREQYSEEIIGTNLVYIVNELRGVLLAQRDVLAEVVFKKLLAQKQLRFMVIGKNLGRLPQSKVVKATSRALRGSYDRPVQRSLFEIMPEEEFNGLEKDVALYLDGQEPLFFWHRNPDRLPESYFIQGWKRHKIYPDFIFTEAEDQARDANRVFVVETKGLHLKNDDTDYKNAVLELCNLEAKEANWGELKLDLKQRVTHFELLFENEWRTKLNRLLGA